jgi:hypothetical protein
LVKGEVNPSLVMAVGLADGPEISIQPGTKFRDQRLSFLDLFFRKQAPGKRPPHPVPDFIQGSSGYFDEPSIFLVGPAAAPFGDIGTDTINCSGKLPPYGIFGKLIPIRNNPPDLIRQFLSQLVNLQFLEAMTLHNSLPFKWKPS